MRPIFSLCLALLLCQGFAQGGTLSDLSKRQEGTSKRETSTRREGPDKKYSRSAPPKGDLEEGSNWDNFRVAPGQTHTLMDVKGPGVITHIWLTFLGPEPQGWAPQGSANHQEMLLRIYWDGDERPAVEAPVGDFFANAFGKRRPVISVPVVVEDADSYNSFWHMPFRKSARVEIVNQSAKNINLLYYNIDWIQKPVAKDVPYFHAQYRQEYPVENGKDYVVLETQGKGHYVGTVMSVRSRSPSWFGEGDEKIYIDGEKAPSIWGTGTEDYFLSAWGLQTTSTPYFGTPYFDQWGIVGGHTSAYRWHITDPIVFQKGIKVTFEHWGWISPDENKDNKSMSWNEREDDYSSVAFWYQTGRSTFVARAPVDRTLPTLDKVVSFARDSTFHGIGTFSKQQLSLYPGEQVLYMPPTSGVSEYRSGNDPGAPQQIREAWIEVPFKVTDKEPLRLVLNMTTSYDFGKYEAFVIPPGSTKKVKVGGVMDLYSKDVESREFHLLDFWPESGTYKVRLECIGKNPVSQGHYLGIESVRLRERRPRVKQMGWDKNKDWKVDPKLYG
jgi:hypothetical protein